MRNRQKHWWGAMRFTNKQARRIRSAVADNDAPRDRSPFSLGIDNERWEESIPALIIPIPGSDLNLLCIRTYDGSYQLNTLQDQLQFPDLIMAAAVTYEWVKKYENNKVGKNQNK